MANVFFNNPVTSDTRTAVLQYIRDATQSQARMFDGDTLNNAPDGTVRYDLASRSWQRWNGSSWLDLRIMRIISDEMFNPIITNAPIHSETYNASVPAWQSTAYNNGDAVGLVQRRASGTNPAAPGLLGADDRFAFLVGGVGNGTAFFNSAGISLRTAGTQGAASLPSQIIFETARVNQTAREPRMRILPGSIAGATSGFGADSPVVVIPSMPGEAGGPSLLIEGNNNRERIWIRSGATGAGVVKLEGSGGTPYAPTATVLDQGVGSFQGGGFDGVTWARASWLGFYADGNWSGTSWPMRAEIWTTPAGSTTIQRVVQFGSNRVTTFDGNVSLPSTKLTFGETTRQMVDLWQTSYGIGVQSSTLYLRTGGGNFCVFSGGSHVDSLRDPGPGGGYLFEVNSSGHAFFGARSGAGVVQSILTEAGLAFSPGTVSGGWAKGLIVQRNSDSVRIGGAGWLSSNEAAPGAFHISSGNASWWDRASYTTGVEFNFGSATYQYLKGSNPTIWWQDTDNRSFAIHVNGNTAYFMRGGVGDTSWTGINDQFGASRWMCTFDLGTGEVNMPGWLRVWNDILVGNELRVGDGQNAEKRLRMLNANRDVYFYLNGTTVGLYDNSGGISRWTTDTSGNFTAAGNVTAYSDERLKRRFKRFYVSLDDLVGLGSFEYERKDTGERQIGVKAQALRRIMPLAVNDGEYLSVDYGRAAMVGVLSLARELKKLNGVVDGLAK